MLSALHYDLVRSLNKKAPWMVMEQTSSRVNWREHNIQSPGRLCARATGGGPGRHRGPVFPVASVPARAEKFPFGHAFSLRYRLSGVGRGSWARPTGPFGLVRRRTRAGARGHGHVVAELVGAVEGAV